MMKRLSILLYMLGSVLALLVWTPKTVGQEEKYPLAVSVKLKDGSDLPELEDELINAINELGYPVIDDAFILAEGLVSITGEKQMGGASPKFMIDFKLDIQIKDSEQGKILESFSATGKGLGNTGKEAFQKGLQQIKIDTAELSEILANCQDDYFRIQERRHLLSKGRFEEGEHLFQQKRYREALAELKLIYPETKFFPKAQKLIRDIRRIMPKPVIAVLKFKTDSDDIAENFRDILTTALVRMQGKEVSVLEREQISKITEELKLKIDGLVDPVRASEVGKFIGADCLLLGSLIRNGDEIEVDAKLVRVGTAEILTAFHKKELKEHLGMIGRDIVGEIQKAIVEGAIPLGKVQILLSNISFGQLIKFEDAIKSIEGITEVHRHSYSEGMARLDVECSGDAQGLADKLYLQDFADFKIEITSFSANKVEVEIK